MLRRIIPLRNCKIFVTEILFYTITAERFCSINFFIDSGQYNYCNQLTKREKKLDQIRVKIKPIRT